MHPHNGVAPLEGGAGTKIDTRELAASFRDKNSSAAAPASNMKLKGEPVSALPKEVDSRDKDQRKERAHRIVGRRGVRRDGDCFRVQSETYTGRGPKPEYEVFRDEQTGRVCCACPDFKYQHGRDPSFRCKHIIAVKLFLVDEGGAHGSEGNAAAPGTERSTRLAEASCTEPRVVALAPRMFKRLLEKLRETVSAEELTTRGAWSLQGGESSQVEAIRWERIATLLDEHAPTWCHQIVSVTKAGELVMIVARITIDGVSREGLGTGLLMSESAVLRAEVEALAAAAAKFGMRAHKEHDGRG